MKHFYVSYVQFTDGSHDCYMGLCENGLVVKDYAKEKFNKEVLMTHSVIIAPDVSEISPEMIINATVWYKVRDIFGDTNV